MLVTEHRGKAFRIGAGCDCQIMRRLRLVLEGMRMCVEIFGRDVACQDFAVAVDEIGARGFRKTMPVAMRAVAEHGHVDQPRHHQRERRDAHHSADDDAPLEDGGRVRSCCVPLRAAVCWIAPDCSGHLYAGAAQTGDGAERRAVLADGAARQLERGKPHAAAVLSRPSFAWSQASRCAAGLARRLHHSASSTLMRGALLGDLAGWRGCRSTPARRVRSGTRDRAPRMESPISATQKKFENADHGGRLYAAGRMRFRQRAVGQNARADCGRSRQRPACAAAR